MDAEPMVIAHRRLEGSASLGSFGRDTWSLAKPGITGLILVVAVGGFVISSTGTLALGRLALLLVCGTLASFGAGMLNHVIDRDLDAQMRRTHDRPLPSARIQSPARVALVGTVLSGVGVAGAAVGLNLLAGVSILLGGVTYVVVYSILLKRRSSWNIVIGGFAGSAPVLAGSAALTGTWTPAALALALLVFLWTPPHFWSLALRLRDDYARAALPMLPRMNDPRYSGRIVVVSAALLVPAAGLVVWTAHLTPLIGALLLAITVGFVVVSAPLWSRPGKSEALRGFLYSGPYLLGVVGLVVLNAYLVGLGLRGTWL